MLPMALSGVLPFIQPLLNLVAHEFSKAKATTHSSLCFLHNICRLPAGMQRPSQHYRAHIAADPTQKELSPHCQSVTFSPAPLSGNEKQPKLDHTYITTAPGATLDTTLTGYGASKFPGRMGSNPQGNWIWEEWTIPWFVWNVIEDTGWMLIRKKKVLIINISMGSV